MQPERIHAPKILRDLLALNGGPGDAITTHQVKADFSARRWLADPRNIALRIDSDMAMFEYLGPGVAMGHIWFHSRGRKAFTRAKALLDHMGSDYGVSRIMGEVPCWRHDVQRFVRKLGFSAIGVAERPIGKVIVHQLALGNTNSLALVA